MDKVQVLVRSHSDFAGGVDELTFRGTGTLEKTDYGYRLRYTAQNELDGSAVASEMRLETQQRRAVVITESKDGGYGLLLDPQRQTVTQIAGGDGGALTLHVETVVLLSKGEVDSKKIRVEFSLEDMDMSEFQDGATYTQIKDYVLEHSGLKVSNLYISQIKRKCGIEVGKNYNLPKSEDSRQPQCPPEKEKAIREAFKYFGMI